MQTPYHGRARIGVHPVDVDIVNVDMAHWKGTATTVGGVAAAAGEAVVTLLDQPRPGWSARAVATGCADGVLQLEGHGQFHAPPPRPVEPGTRSLWVKKSPPRT
jgi:hypothetical protein